MAVSLVVAMPPQRRARAAGASSATTPSTDSVPVTSLPGGVAERAADSDESWSPPQAQWPAGGSVRADAVAADAVVDEGSWPVAGGLPVLVRSTGGAGAAGSVRVEVADRAATDAVGVAGVVFTLARGDGLSGDTAAGLEVDYSAFAHMYGGDYGNRLRLVSLPACALTTPEVPECLTTTPVAGASNQVARRRIVVDSVAVAGDAASAQTRDSRSPSTAESVTAASGGLVYALTALAASPDTGGFNKTSLSQAASWTAGTSGGDFSWSYPLSLPPAPAGATPQVVLGYSSGSVDGRTNAESAQTSALGEGWDYVPGYIERSFISCAEDTSGAYWTNAVPDSCWQDYNATLVWNGRSTPLVLDDTTNLWRLADDDGTKVSKYNGGVDTHFWNDENWKLTTPDGTQYWFGRTQLPGWTTGDRETASVMGMPVFANHSGEPGFSSSSFASSWTQPAYRWNLDYVVDPAGNSYSFFYSKEAAQTGINNGSSTATYSRSSVLSRIEYGTRTGHEYDYAYPPLQAVFANGYRCLSSCGTASAPTTANWPDTPWDLDCALGSTSCPDNATPSFWSYRWYTGVTTQIVTNQSTGTTRDVDSWSFAHSFPDTNEAAVDPAAWLVSINRTGKAGAADVSVPQVAFSGTRYANRTDYNTSAGVPMVKRYRITSIANGTGGHILVTYEGSDCTTSSQADPDNNSKRCFPQYYAPPGSSAGWSWWNKYRVIKVVEQDSTVSSGAMPDVEHAYAYSTSGSSSTVLWHHNDNPWGAPLANRSWSDFRGWSTVTVTTGASSGTQSKSSYLYFRGLDLDRTDAGDGTRDVTTTDSNGSEWRDWDQRRGFLRERIDYLGNTSTAVYKQINSPWQAQTAQRVESGLHPSTFTAYFVRTLSSTTLEWVAATSSWRSSQTSSSYDTTYGLPTATADAGDLAVSDDAVCTQLSYARNTSTYLVSYVSEQLVTDCAASPAPANYLGGTRTYYDGSTTLGAAPSVGLATKSTVLADFTGTTANWAPASETGYDALGRVTSVKDALSRQSTTAYTPSGGGPVTQVVVTNPASQATTTTLDPAWGLPLTQTDPNSKTTTAEYDGLGRLVKVWLPGRSTSLTPNAQYTYQIQTAAPSYVATATLGPSGAQNTSYEIYDGLLRLRQTQSPAPVANGGRMIADTTYDSRGLSVKASSFWNSASGPASALVAFADTDVDSQHRYTYDGLGRVTVDALWSQNVSKWQTATGYDAGRVTTTPPAGGTATTVFSDVHGSTTTLRQFLGASASGSYQDTTYQYDLLQHLVAMTDVAGDDWTYTIDRRGRQTASGDPDKGAITSTYDDAGQLLSSTDARSVKLSYVYDNLGRRTAVWQGDVSTGTKLADWTYDTLAAGQLTSASRYSGGNTYTTAATGYDDGYRPLGASVTLPAAEGALAGTWTTTMTYKVNGAVESTTLPAGGGLPAETVTTTYDSVGYALTVAGAATYVAGTSYYPWGDVYQRLLGGSGSQVRLTTTHDVATDRLTGSKVETEHAGTPGTFDEQRDDAYFYSDAGSVTSVAETVTGSSTSRQCFTYDGLQRLTQAWSTAAGACQSTVTTADVGGPAAYWSTWTIDGVGNRTGQTLHNLVGGSDAVTSYAYPTAGGTRPHAVSTATTGSVVESFGYDGAGNMSSRAGGSASQTLGWDAQGRLASQTVGAQTTTFVYDADGNRLLRKDPDGSVTAFLGGYELLKSSSGVVSCTRYYGDVASRTSSGLTWTTTDHHGTAQVAVDASSLVVTTRYQSPYGEARGSAVVWPNSKGFVGGTQDPTGLVHLGAREYDPELGRFISVDPIQDLSDPQQWNGYAYANNNPTTGSDPSGLMQLCGDEMNSHACGSGEEGSTPAWKNKSSKSGGSAGTPCGGSPHPVPCPTPWGDGQPPPTGGNGNGCAIEIRTGCLSSDDPQIRPGNILNGSDSLALLAVRILGSLSNCIHGEAQIICFDVDANGQGRPETVGDVLLYPGSEEQFEDQLDKDRSGRATIDNICNARGRCLRGDQYGSNLVEHEARHSDQWAMKKAVGHFAFWYSIESLVSKMKCGDSGTCNGFEVAANSWQGGYMEPPMLLNGEFVDSSGVVIPDSQLYLRY